jgi:hypothetical protein
MAPVVETQQKEFMPVCVAYRQLRTRVTMMETACQTHDYRQIQQLLHGSLLVQVNEGPSKMAEVFLAEPAPDDNYRKWANKLRLTFGNFLAVNEKGLRLHAKWTKENTAFRPLQDELESGFTSLAEKLAKYL